MSRGERSAGDLDFDNRHGSVSTFFDCAGDCGKLGTMKTKLFHPVVSLVAGVLVLMYPHLLSTVVGWYLIIVGILGLMKR